MALDRLTSLTVFGQVVESGGFSAAARRLGMSTTMVSNHVQALEERLGVRLLQRTTRRVGLTEIGKAYLERTRQILLDLDEADRVAAALHATPRGPLRIYSTTALIPFLGSIVSEFMQRNPEVSIDLTAGDHMVDLVEQGFDLAVRTAPPLDSSFVVRRLTGWRHVLCCSPDFLQAHPPPKRPSDLTRYNCMRYQFYPWGEEWRFTDRAGEPISVKVSGNVVANSPELLRALAFAGHGILLVPSFLVVDDIKAGRLVRLLPRFRPPELAISALYPHRHHLSTKVRLFIDLLAERFADLGSWTSSGSPRRTP
jgi:DNA-binding transcriptional LysR family regulator